MVLRSWYALTLTLCHNETNFIQFSLELRHINVLLYILKFCYEFFVAVGC
jgi:hypothetical protein